MEDSETGDFDNPALHPLFTSIRPTLQALLDGSGQDADERWDVMRLAGEARNYIADVAWHLLRPELRGDHLDAFLEFLRNPVLDDVSVFTLNHDTLLERVAEAERPKFTDGFGRAKNGVRYWQPELFRRSASKRRLIQASWISRLVPVAT